MLIGYRRFLVNPTTKPLEIVLGISDSITSGAALAVGGRIVAAVNEERLSRVKMAMGWPRLSIREVLRLGAVDPKAVEKVAVATKDLFWRPEPQGLKDYFEGKTWSADKKFVMGLGSMGSRLFGDMPAAQYPYYWLKRLLCMRRRRAIRRELRDMGVDAPIVYVDHHLAHAASAYYTGGHLDATIATLDGAGDGISATIYRGRRGDLERLAVVSSYDSVGNFYSYVTHILGFKAHQHEGKITGLAAYGRPIYADLIRKMVHHRDGRIENTARAFHIAAINKLRALIPADADRADVAASIQSVLEEVCTGFVGHWVRRLGARHLGVAGGVVANVKLNQRLLALDGVPSIYIHPGMGDDGLALGAALYVHARNLPAGRRAGVVYELPHAYLGPTYGESEMTRTLEAFGLSYQKPSDIAREVARLIADGKVVARFDGRMEYGPRALGNRSILLHAGDPTVNDWLNKKLQRTEFMPFAPVTLVEETDDCYEGLGGAEHTARFMTITCGCKPKLKETCPAVVHVDETARPQLVGPDENPGYRRILEEYRKLRGFSTIINTSFNMHEEPIVCTVEDALRAFTLGHLDYLALGDFLVAGAENPLPSERS